MRLSLALAALFTLLARPHTSEAYCEVTLPGQTRCSDALAAQLEPRGPDLAVGDRVALFLNLTDSKESLAFSGVFYPEVDAVANLAVPWGSVTSRFGSASVFADLAVPYGNATSGTETSQSDGSETSQSEEEEEESSSSNEEDAAVSGGSVTSRSGSVTSHSGSVTSRSGAESTPAGVSAQRASARGAPNGGSVTPGSVRSSGGSVTSHSGSVNSQNGTVNSQNGTERSRESSLSRRQTSGKDAETSQEPRPHTSSEVRGLAATSRFVRAGRKQFSDGDLAVPYRTVILTLRKGRLTSAEWEKRTCVLGAGAGGDENCDLTVPGNRDLSVLVVWEGTDRDGKILKSVMSSPYKLENAF